MARFKLTLEYDGGGFDGWQRQSERPSVQGALEHALQSMTGEAAEVYGAGRTDAGVHALGQAAHVDIAKPVTPDRLREALNALVRPAPVTVLRVEEAADDFHARFDATARIYWYRILNRRAPPALERGRVWHVARKLDRDAMDEAASYLVGQHDFTTFRDAQCQAKSPVKTLDRMDVMQAGEEIHVRCAARSFLHRQVRSMVGAVVEAGWGRRTPRDVRAALEARDRARCGQVAPAEGLYLERVEYAPRQPSLAK
ncbi:MAG: tRNA pseudouridine(38-40) synthase TruA [Hyphomonadaceae bacterium]